MGRLKPLIADSAKPNADLDKSCQSKQLIFVSTKEK